MNSLKFRLLQSAIVTPAIFLPLVWIGWLVVPTISIGVMAASAAIVAITSSYCITLYISAMRSLGK